MHGHRGIQDALSIEQPVRAPLHRPLHLHPPTSGNDVQLLQMSADCQELQQLSGSACMHNTPISGRAMQRTLCYGAACAAQVIASWPAPSLN